MTMPEDNLIEMYDPYAGYTDIVPTRPAPPSNLMGIRICQPTSGKPQTAGITIGAFYLTTFEEDEQTGNNKAEYYELGSTIDIVPLRMRETRALWEEGQERPLCRSADNITGVGTPGGDCKTCPLAQWQGNKPPACAHILDFLTLSPQVGAPASFPCSRGSAKIGWGICDDIERRGWGRAGYRLSLKRVVEPGRTYFALQTEPLDGNYTAQVFSEGAAMLAMQPVSESRPNNALPAGGGPAYTPPANNAPANAPPPAATPPAKHWQPPARGHRPSPEPLPPGADIDDLPF